MSAPATPVVLAVLLDLQAALQSITRANGCFYDVKPTSVSLDPIALQSVPVPDVPAFVIELPPSGEITYQTSRPTAVKNDFTIQVHARVDAPGQATDRTRKTIAALRLVADIERRLAVDPQRSNVALYTYVAWPEIFFGEPSQSEIYLTVPVRVLLQRTYGEP